MMDQTYKAGPWKAENPHMPVLFLAGADDPCIISETKFNQAVNRMRQAGYSNVKSRLYPGMRHEILNEIDKITVWNDLLDFIKGRKFWQ
jgi:alpha-beta hydrolase superfamily lysophospholipase